MRCGPAARISRVAYAHMCGVSPPLPLHRIVNGIASCLSYWPREYAFANGQLLKLYACSKAGRSSCIRPDVVPAYIGSGISALMLTTFCPSWTLPEGTYAPGAQMSLARW